MNIRNILLIGRTGSGKSTLANVLMNEDRFSVSGKSISATKNIEEGVFEVDLDKEGNEKIKYRVIDTIGIGDTNMTPQGVLMRLAEMAGRVKKEGLNQILFITRLRFTKEEIEAYDLLSSIIFDKNVVKHTTIVKTGFEDFEDEEACEEDRESLKKENLDLAHIIKHVKVIYVDNPPLKGRSASTNKIIREESRKRLLTYLATCEGNYRPSNIDELDERVRDYLTNEEKLQKKLVELEEERKKQEEEFRKEIAEIEKKHKEDLKNLEEKSKKDIDKVREEGETNLKNTKRDIEAKAQKDIADLNKKHDEEIKGLKGDFKQKTEEVKKDYDQKLKNIQDENAKNREKDEKLIKELQSKIDSSGSKIDSAVANLKSQDSEHNKRLVAEAEVRKKELEIEKYKAEKEQERLDKELEVKKKEAEKEQAIKDKLADAEIKLKKEEFDKEQARKDKINEEETKLKQQEREAKERRERQETEARDLKLRRAREGFFERVIRDTVAGRKGY